MTPARYRKVYDWFTARPAALAALAACTRLLPLVQARGLWGMMTSTKSTIASPRIGTAQRRHV